MFPESARTGMDRRDFLRLGGAGLAGAVLLGTGVTAASRAAAQTGPPLEALFDAAAAQYAVPEKLLKAMGYVNTLWEMPPASATPYDPDEPHGRGAYGLMQLVRNPSKDTLGRAASLIGLSEEEIKTDRAANVKGGAAVLSDLAGFDRSSDLNGWYEIVSGYGSGPLYAHDVYDVLHGGASATISTGERIELMPQPEAETRIVPASRTRADYEQATWYGNNGENSSSWYRGAKMIDKIVIHVAQGSYSGTLDWFRNPSNTGSSTHYTVSKQGAIGQSVKEENVAWHAGWWDTNKQSISIEHAGYIGNPDWFTDKMYDASARLSAYLSKKYGIPLDRQHVIAHKQVPGCNGSGGGVSCHVDPGDHWNWKKYMRWVKYHRRGL